MVGLAFAGTFVEVVDTFVVEAVEEVVVVGTFEEEADTFVVVVVVVAELVVDTMVFVELVVGTSAVVGTSVVVAVLEYHRNQHMDLVRLMLLVVIVTQELRTVTLDQYLVAVFFE